jgi:hypothetical protein
MYYCIDISYFKKYLSPFEYFFSLQNGSLPKQIKIPIFETKQRPGLLSGNLLLLTRSLNIIYYYVIF